jgi:hypothetical protein
MVRPGWVDYNCCRSHSTIIRSLPVPRAPESSIGRRVLRADLTDLVKQIPPAASYILENELPTDSSPVGATLRNLRPVEPEPEPEPSLGLGLGLGLGLILEVVCAVAGLLLCCAGSVPSSPPSSPSPSPSCFRVRVPAVSGGRKGVWVQGSVL